MNHADRARARRHIVVKQRVTEAKVHGARHMRRDMTPEEQLLWEALRTNRLDGLHFRRQQIIDGFIVDFYCHAAGLVVEVDGAAHHTQAEYDAARDRVLSARNLFVLRVTNEEVSRSLPRVLSHISAVAHDRRSHR
jgi:very-short-patch-repair endonuclease